MPTARPFTYNTGSTISGTEQVGNLAIGFPDEGFESTGLKWWNGPNEDLGYVIAHQTPSGNQPNQFSIPAYLGFWRSTEKTEQSFIDLAEYVSNVDNDPQTFSTGSDAKVWLTNNGYWSSYFQYIISAGKTDTGGNQVGEPIQKDMSQNTWSYPSQGLPGNSSQNISASYWSDWGEDIFDAWGYFYLYDPAQNNYLGLNFNPNDVNLADGQFRTQVFTFNSRTFTITQGYPVQGIFKFEIRVDDDQPFVFGEGGNMGSDGSTVNNDLSYSYTLEGTNLTLWYNENYQVGNETERFYSYYIPFVIDENNTKTYTDYMDGSDNLYLYSRQCTHGLTVYHSKEYDVKQWVVYDLEFGE
jgi:hypothetical protein